MQRASNSFTTITTTTIPLGDRRSCRAAFSLIDLTVTVLIVAIVAATAVPRLSGAVQYYQVDGAARRIEADLNYARSYARFANTACTMTFTNSPASYTTTGVPHLNNSGAAYAVTLANEGYPVTLATNLNSSLSITFNPNGVPQAGSPVMTALTTGTISISNGSQSRIVTIDPTTGKARRI